MNRFEIAKELARRLGNNIEFTQAPSIEQLNDDNWHPQSFELSPEDAAKIPATSFFTGPDGVRTSETPSCLEVVCLVLEILDENKPKYHFDGHLHFDRVFVGDPEEQVKRVTDSIDRIRRSSIT